MPFVFNKYIPLRNIIFALGEGVLIFLAVGFVQFFFLSAGSYWTDLPIFVMRALLVTLVFQISLYYFDLYDLSGRASFQDTAIRITQAFGVGCIVLAIPYYFFPEVIISMKIFLAGYLATCISIALWRFFYALVLDRRMFTEPILLVGAGEQAERIAAEIESRRDSGYKVAAVVGEGALPSYWKHQTEAYPDAGNLLEKVNAHKVEKIVVALEDRRGKMPIKELMACKLQGIPIEVGITFYEGLTGKILVEKVNPSWIIFSEGFKKSNRAMLAKRFLDIGLSVIGLVLAAPLGLLSAAIIKLESPGPVFYTQERVGEKGRIFRVVKFRSMRQDAEKDGPVWARQNDTRVTRFGAFIRKIRIDELPQLWNVFKGEMSFVGPRPERPMFVEQLAREIPYYSLRHSVRPGLTGWAQICYPYGASKEDALRKLEYDLYYIKNMTLRLDLWIIFETIKTVLFQKGAR